MSSDGAAHAPGCNCFNCLTPADQSFVSGDKVFTDDPNYASRVHRDRIPVEEKDQAAAEKEARKIRRKEKNLIALASMTHKPVPIGYAIQKFNRKLRLAISLETLVKGKTKPKKLRQWKTRVRNAKFRFLKNHFRSILKITKIQDKWTICKNRFDAAQMDMLVRTLPNQELGTHPFTKISVQEAIKIVAEGDPGLVSFEKISAEKLTGETKKNGKKDKKTKNKKKEMKKKKKAVSHGALPSDVPNEVEDVPPPLSSSMDHSQPSPPTSATNLHKRRKPGDRPMFSTFTTDLIFKISRVQGSEVRVTEVTLANSNDSIPVFQVSPPEAPIKEIEIDSEPEESNAMDDVEVELEVTPPVPAVTTNLEETSSGVARDSTEEIQDGYMTPPRHSTEPLDDSIPELDVSSPVTRRSFGKGNSKRKRAILDSDDELPPPSDSSQKSKESFLKPCQIRLERLNSPRGPKMYKRIRTDYSIPEDPRKLIHGAESARQRQTSDSESDIDFRPSALNSSCSSSDSTLSNETDSPASPSTEDSDIVVESEEYGASELDEEAELERQRRRNRKRMKPLIILKTVEERRKLREQRLKMKAEKRKRKAARLEYREAHLGHLEYSPVNISYAVDVVTKKLNWDIFPFGAKVLGTTLKKKELESLTKAHGSTEWWVLKKAFVIKHFREVFRIEKSTEVRGDFVCCKNTVDFLDCKAFLKIFWGISIH